MSLRDACPLEKMMQESSRKIQAKKLPLTTGVNHQALVHCTALLIFQPTSLQSFSHARISSWCPVHHLCYSRGSNDADELVDYRDSKFYSSDVRRGYRMSKWIKFGSKGRRKRWEADHRKETAKDTCLLINSSLKCSWHDGGERTWTLRGSGSLSCGFGGNPSRSWVSLTS